MEILLDLEKKTVSYYVNEKVAREDAFANLPEGTYHFYYSGAEGDDVEIIEQRLYISSSQKYSRTNCKVF